MGESRGQGPAPTFYEERTNALGDVVVVRVGVGHAGAQADVRRHHRGARRRRLMEVLGIGEPADVVADARAHGVGLASDRRSPRVHTERHVEAPGQLGDDRYHAVELFRFADLLAGTGLHSPNIEQVRALFDELFGASKERLKFEGRGRCVEGVLRPVEDPHHQRARGEIDATVPERDHQRPHGPKDRH